jgi:hypothetical protein
MGFKMVGNIMPCHQTFAYSEFSDCRTFCGSQKLCTIEQFSHFLQAGMNYLSVQGVSLGSMRVEVRR